MAFTNHPSTRPIDAVRSLVGDVSTSDTTVYLSDNTYTYFIAQTPNFFSAGALAANAIAAFFMGKGSEVKVGDLIVRRDMANSFRALAIELKTMSAKGIAPYAGGISRSDKRANQQNTDLVSPAFRRSEFDNRYALDPQSSTST